MDLGDRVSVSRDGVSYEGILMPTRSDNVVIKLDNGYNVALRRPGCKIQLIAKGRETVLPERQLSWREGLPQVSILSTGGTIASKVDYRTGAVTSQFTAGEIISAIPDLEEIANYRAKVIYSILSENMMAEYWSELARAVADEIRSGSEGVIVTHGTDTMTYTAAALSFMIETPVPVVLVGSQRSSDRPSSDSSMNAISAATVAISDIAEVSVVMHEGMSDDYCSIHRGTRVRKMHTSRRDAFKSINQPPIGRVDYLRREIETFGAYRRRGDLELALHKEIEPRCALVKFFPGASSKILDYYVDEGYKGMVIEGTGLGHVASSWIASIRRAVDSGIPVIVTSQCMRGRICDRVYDTGRDMLAAGALEGRDMLAEVALVKLMWALANTSAEEELESVICSPIAGEISASTPATT